MSMLNFAAVVLPYHSSDVPTPFSFYNSIDFYLLILKPNNISFGEILLSWHFEAQPLQPPPHSQLYPIRRSTPRRSKYSICALSISTLIFNFSASSHCESARPSSSKLKRLSIMTSSKTAVNRCERRGKPAPKTSSYNNL